MNRGRKSGREMGRSRADRVPRGRTEIGARDGVVDGAPLADASGYDGKAETGAWTGPPSLTRRVMMESFGL